LENAGRRTEVVTLRDALIKRLTERSASAALNAFPEWAVSPTQVT